MAAWETVAVISVIARNNQSAQVPMRAYPSTRLVLVAAA